MKYKAYITRLKNRFTNKKPVLRDPQLMHPDREWAIGLAVAVLIFSLCGLWSIHSYLKNRTVSAIAVEDTSTTVVYRESVVKDTLAVIAARDATLTQLTTGLQAPVVVPEEVATTTPAASETPAPIEEPESDNSVPVLGE